MLFNENEMEVAKQLAWEMLDAYNHAYCPNLDDYALFYYKDQPILDPWMNELSQNLPWPDHESVEVVVDPVSYYGEDTIEQYLVRLFTLSFEREPIIAQKVLQHVSYDGTLMRIGPFLPFEVYVAMSFEQALEEHRLPCLMLLPDSGRIYLELDKLPRNLIVDDKCQSGGLKIITFKKEVVKKVFSILYPDGITFEYKSILYRIRGRVVSLIGFTD